MNMPTFQHIPRVQFVTARRKSLQYVATVANESPRGLVADRIASAIGESLARSEGRARDRHAEAWRPSRHSLDVGLSTLTGSIPSGDAEKTKEPHKVALSFFWRPHGGQVVTRRWGKSSGNGA